MTVYSRHMCMYSMDPSHKVVRGGTTKQHIFHDSSVHACESSKWNPRCVHTPRATPQTWILQGRKGRNQAECRLKKSVDDDRVGWGMRHANQAEVMPKETLYRASGEEEEGAEILTWGRSLWPGGQMASFVPEQTPADYPSSPEAALPVFLSCLLSFMHKFFPL